MVLQDECTDMFSRTWLCEKIWFMNGIVVQIGGFPDNVETVHLVETPYACHVAAVRLNDGAVTELLDFLDFMTRYRHGRI